MDIHHLKIFYETCKEKSFTKAAKKLFISQSAVSIQIKKLEQSLSIQLIERNSKTFKLTMEGKELFKLSKDIFNKIACMENEIKKIVRNHNTKIIIGATHNIGEPVLPNLISDYSKEYPDAEFEIYIKNSSSLINYIKEGIIDIALMEEEFLEERDLKFLQTDVYPFVVIAPSNVKNISKIKNFNMLKKSSPLIQKYIETFEDIIDYHFEKQVIVDGSNETIKNLVINGMGIAVLPYYCVYDAIKEKKVSLVHKFEKLEDKFQIVYLRENEKKERISNFIEFLKNYNINFDSDSLI